MKTASSINFLIGFLGFFVFLVAVISTSFISDKTSLNDSKKFNKVRIIEQLIWLFPFLITYIYFFIIGRAGLYDFFVLVFLPSITWLGYEYLFFRPKLSVLKSDARRKATSIKLDGKEARYSFDSTIHNLLLNQDKLEYMRGWLVDLRIDRIYKNNFSEYFLVQGSAKSASEPTIKHIDFYTARNLLRIDRDVYMQEFNEEPYSQK